MLAGCENFSDLTNPVLNSEPESINKITKFDFELIPLPPKSPVWEDSIFTVSQIIDGNVGGRIILEKYYIDAKGDSVSIFADLRIPEGAFQGTENITITADDQFAAIHFYPSMAFEDTLKLFQSFEGIDLSNYTNGTIDFVFIDDDGNVELIKKNGTQIVIPQGIVRVQNAKLQHFSRYGWIRSPLNPVTYPNLVAD